MRRPQLLCILLIAACCCAASLAPGTGPNAYRERYDDRLSAVEEGTGKLARTIAHSDPRKLEDRARIIADIERARTALKAFDLWSRYLAPNTYRLINGPLPVEWETEVFEKYEKPYKRIGAGLTLAELYLEEPGATTDSLLRLVNTSIGALQVFHADSITRNLDSPDHFFLCNRLFLLNLAAIYTTAFECPDTAHVVPELRSMLHATAGIYEAFNTSFPATAISDEYLERFRALTAFADAQPQAFSAFDHFALIRDHVGPLFTLNQEFIERYHARSHSFMDYSLNGRVRSIFSKDLYIGQDAKGIYRRVTDTTALAAIDRLGKRLFFDPLLSGNGQRSCASCHRADMCFTDTTRATSIAFDHNGALPRNTPTLVNADLNHLLMQDGRHTTLQAQAKDVITNATELGSAEADVLNRVMSCPDYRRAFEALLPNTPTEKKVTMEHVISALTLYYTKFSMYRSSFDDAMDRQGDVDADAHAGFNLFMSKAQCATCHFVPQFNGVKPPYIGSEFEVVGVPEDNAYAMLSDDIGRYTVNPAIETKRAFRTGGLRNIARTAPYMHNGVFRTLREVIDFYDAGGGAGHRLDVPNQTLSADSLHLNALEKRQLEAFLRSLNENLPMETPPASLPVSRDKSLNARKPGGEY